MNKQKMTSSQQQSQPLKDQSKYYFTDEHEKAIIEYAHSTDSARRDFLYEKIIAPVFSEIVDKIVFTFKFTNLPNIDVLKEECKTQLATLLDKFDEEKGFKAFAYFSVITKNWFIHKIKKNSQKIRREVNYDEITNLSESEFLSTPSDYLVLREREELWYHLNKTIEEWGKESMKSHEKKVYEAIKILLNSSAQVEIFNKKAIYLYLREITGLNTKQIVSGLNTFKKKYLKWRSEWNAGKI